MRRLYIVGFPGLYGGAGTELHHQIILWRRAFPQLELHIIPTSEGHKNEPLYKPMLDIGVLIHNALDFSAITSDDAVISFCSGTFLSNLIRIKQKTDRIAFVNCMTYLFPAEKQHAAKNNINFFLYQRQGVLDDHSLKLKTLGSKAQFLQFSPYFDESSCEYSVKDQEFTHIGRISRQDADKFAKETLHIYEYIVSPKMKRGHFLGFDQRSQAKIGKPFDWIKTYHNHKELSVKDFYNQVDFIVQPTNTLENWPRIGLEAMHSGKPLIVDNRGGWQTMIEHGVSGFLCDTPRDFIYWGSRMAYEPEFREDVAQRAKIRASHLSGYGASAESWKKIFEKMYE